VLKQIEKIIPEEYFYDVDVICFGNFKEFDERLVLA
jgi:hypothetical protein